MTNTKRFVWFFSIVLIFYLLFGFSGTIVKAETIVEGKLTNGRFLVPMRKIFEKLDTEVSWNDSKRTVKGKNSDVTVKLEVDSNKAYINGNKSELDVTPAIHEGRVFVPFRFIGESLGSEVFWNDEEEFGKINGEEKVIKTKILAEPQNENPLTSNSHSQYPEDKFIINNPYKNINWETINQYKANFHTHTEECHGKLSFVETISRYHKAGYDILSITSHDTLQTEETTWPWTDYGKDPDELGMLAVEGNEISKPNHIGSFFNSYGDATETSEKNALKEINNKDGLAIMFHPGRYDKKAKWYVELFNDFYMEPLVGIEVYNMLDRHPEEREIWDNINSVMMPKRTVFGYSNDDMHKEYQLSNNYQYMLMPELTEENLRESMKNGAFFFSYEKHGSGNEKVPQINKVKVDEKEIKIKAEDYDKIKWIGEGTSKFGEGKSINVSDLDTVFVRGVVVNRWGRTYTQPFALNPNVN
ncbi:stalk domain-containing protein [Natranaerofaba carboxydovora]|uniref:stalk domain-containing protein n=1 Tax=Natranaerofaba carboxydovora TaxID=2742683 RepID=UPI001F13E153|nr:stalk domain-containing protein [Natranaerofaba carboxydovora]UMZ74899.1 hypothetical protein ACONDI_02503 [Natranaerofaba carboxydovora]